MARMVFISGPAPEHYRCVQCLISKMRRVRISDTVQFFPYRIPFPSISLNDCLTAALDEIATTLSNP